MPRAVSSKRRLRLAITHNSAGPNELAAAEFVLHPLPCTAKQAFGCRARDNAGPRRTAAVRRRGPTARSPVRRPPAAAGPCSSSARRWANRCRSPARTSLAPERQRLAHRRAELPEQGPQPLDEPPVAEVAPGDLAVGPRRRTAAVRLGPAVSHALHPECLLRGARQGIMTD